MIAPWLVRLRRTASLGQAPLQAVVAYAPPGVLRAMRRRRVRTQVAHAYATVPYYRETMRRLGLGPEEFRDAADLAKLPVLERETVQRDPEYFVSQAIALDALYPRHSGGSSGEPLAVFWDRDFLVRNGAYGQRMAHVMRRATRRLRPRLAYVVLPDPENPTTRAQAMNLIPDRLRSPRMMLSIQDPPHTHVSKLNAFAPDVLGTFGSYLEGLFGYLHRTGKSMALPRAVAYSSDELSDGARRLISERFGIPVFGAYQTIEAPQIGFECEAHTGYHLNHDLYPIRLVDAEARDVPHGESGDVVVSNLANRGTVLLNYRLGDVATAGSCRCPCGRTLPMLASLDGRVDEWLRAPDGEPIHPQVVRVLFATVPGVLRYRVEQVAPGSLVTWVVAFGERPPIERELRRRFAERLGAETRLEVRFVDDLPRTPGGKVRTVVTRREHGSDGGRRSPFTLRRARAGDRDAILEVMRPANMHHVPSAEMGELDLSRFFVAEVDGEIVGASGYALLGPGQGKTTLLAVVPAHARSGIGLALQRRRLEAMRAVGVHTVTTNADRPATIDWYQRHFGYRVVGSLPKEHEFGDPEVGEWTTLQLDLDVWAEREATSRRAG